MMLISEASVIGLHFGSGWHIVGMLPIKGSYLFSLCQAWLQTHLLSDQSSGDKVMVGFLYPLYR